MAATSSCPIIPSSTTELLHEREGMMNDTTEAARKERLAEINAEPGSRGALERQHGQVWDTSQLSDEFEVRGFLAPLVVVRRKADGVLGSLEFQNRPRFYFNFQAHREANK